MRAKTNLFSITDSFHNHILYTREIPKGDIQGMVQAIDEVNEYSKGEDLYIVSALENQDYLFNKLSVSGKVRKQMDRLYKVN